MATEFGDVNQKPIRTNPLKLSFKPNFSDTQRKKKKFCELMNEEILGQFVFLILLHFLGFFPLYPFYDQA